MRFFKKKRLKTVDFTKVSNLGVRKVGGKMNISGDCVDLRDQAVSVQPTVDSQSVSTSSNSGSVMDFLSGSGSSASTIPTQTLSSSPSQSNDIIGIKRAMRNLSTKTEDNSNEVYRMMQKLELLEKKIERLESGRV